MIAFILEKIDGRTPNSVSLNNEGHVYASDDIICIEILPDYNDAVFPCLQDAYKSLQLVLKMMLSWISEEMESRVD